MSGAPRSKRALACIAAAALVWIAARTAEEQPVEASALLTLPGRAAAVVVGDDATSGLWLVDLATNESRLLPFPGHGKKERKTRLDDLEALAPLAGGKPTEFLAVTSHSRNSGGAAKPARSRIARIRLAGDLRSIESVDVYAELREPLLASLAPLLDAPAREAAAERSPARGGLDVEAAASWRGKLLLGLRRPVDRNGQPIVAVLDDPASLFGDGKPQPRFEPPLVLPARPGEGIRGMTEVGDDVLVILSGQDTGAARSRVVRWNPASGAVREVELGGITWTQPEGISLASDGTLWFAQDLEAGAPAGAQAIVACRPRSGAKDAQAGGASPPACVLSALLE